MPPHPALGVMAPPHSHPVVVSPAEPKPGGQGPVGPISPCGSACLSPSALVPQPLVFPTSLPHPAYPSCRPHQPSPATGRGGGGGGRARGPRGEK
jgi:hypothetical protein